MKRILLSLLMVVCLLSFSACIFMGSEDKEFFGKGWVNPRELDTPQAPKLPPRPVADGTPEPVGPSVRDEAPATHNDVDWSTPAPF